jgi:hypothetical protein
MGQTVSREVQKQAQTPTMSVSNILQRKYDKYKEKHEFLQYKAPSSFSEIVPPIVHEVLKSPGHQLDAETRTFMEPRFGYDFSKVRVHTDAKAAESARAVNALAYTSGKDIVFGAGQFSLQTHKGQMLITHELVHVIQQSIDSAQRQLINFHEDLYRRKANNVIPLVGKSASQSDTVKTPGKFTGVPSGRIQRQLITPLGAGGGFGGLMERDRRRTSAEDKAQSGSTPVRIENLTSTGEINPDTIILIEVDLPTATVKFTSASGSTFHGDIVTDLALGEYRLTAKKKERLWIIHGSRPGLRFDLKLRDADPWKMDYSSDLQLRVVGEVQPQVPTTDKSSPRLQSRPLNFYHGTRWSVARTIPGNVKPLGGGDFAAGFYTHQDQEDLRALRRAKTWGMRNARESNEKYAGVVMFSVPNQDYLDLLGRNAKVFDFTRTDQPDYEELQRKWLSFVTAHGREAEPIYDHQRRVWVHPRREPQPQLSYAIVRGPFYGPIKGTPDREPKPEEFHPFAEGKRLPQQVVWANEGISLLNSSKTNTELQQYDAKTGERKDPPEDQAVAPPSPTTPRDTDLPADVPVP